MEWVVKAEKISLVLETVILRKWRSNPKLKGFPGSSGSRESACNEGDLGSIPVLGRFPGERNGNPFQYFCLGNPMDRGV